MKGLRLHIVCSTALLVGSVQMLVGCVDVTESETFIPDGGKEKMELGLGLETVDIEERPDKAGRQTGEVVQIDPSTMNPLTDIQLFGYAATPEEVASGIVSSTTQRLFATPDFSTVVNNVNVNKKGVFSPEEVMPVGLNHFIGYAKPYRKFDPQGSKGPFNEAQLAEFFVHGRSYSSWDSDPLLTDRASRLKDFSFGPYPIYRGDLNDGTCTDANRMLFLLNRMLDVKANVNGKQISIGEVDPNANSELFSIYANYVGNEVGSFRSVQAFLEHIYNELNELKERAAQGDLKQGPYVALIQALMDRILTPADPAASVADPTGAEYIDDIVFRVKDNPDPSSSNSHKLQLELDVKTNPKLKGFSFPEKLGLPDGAMVLHFLTAQEQLHNPYPRFKYVQFETAAVKSNIGLPVNRYAFPAELLYRVDSPVRVSVNKESSKWTGGPQTWEQFLENYPQQTSVEDKTTSVALEQPLKYMVAGLMTKAKLASLSLPQHSEGGGKLVNIKTGFPITGVIVGMQGYTDWAGAATEVAPPGLATEKFVYYDRDLNGTPESQVVTTDYPTKSFSYTLVLESPKGDRSILVGGGEADVAYEDMRTHQYVLLELFNDQENFYGHGGQIIHKGTRFYLVGELKLSKLAAELGNLTEPYVGIFQQGKYLDVQINIQTLSGAYNCVPDLRNPTLGISVETSFQWHNGLIYNDDIPLQ